MTVLTPELLASLPLIESIAISPDGRWIAASVAPISKASEHRISTIWLIEPLGTGEPRQLTLGTTNDHAPRWSPDSTRLAFLSDREKRGTTQLHLLALEGGEALPQTNERGGVAAFRWFPDGDGRIAYLTPATRDEAEEQRRKDERDDAQVYGEFWPSNGLRILDTTTRDNASIEIRERHVSDFEISPDGATLAMVLWDTPDIDNVMTGSELALLDVASGAITRTIQLPSHPRSLTWSHDGATIYYVAGNGPTAVASNQIWSLDIKGDGTPRCLTPTAPFCVDALVRSRDSENILALIARGTESAICVLAVTDERLTELSHFAGNLTGLVTSADGTLVATAGSVAERADEVYAGRPDGELRRVTSFQRAFDDVVLGSQKIVSWERAGMTLDGILIFPPGKGREDGPLPMVVSLHGGPYGRWANAYQHRFGRWIAQHGYLVFMPNPRGGSGHGAEFAEAVLHTVGNEDYLDIMAGVDMLIEQGLADGERLGCGGWSQGGFMTAWIVGQTTRFKAGVMGAGVSDWGMMIATSDIPSYENLMGGGNPFESAGPHSFDAQSPISYLHRATTPVLILHGEQDARVPVSQGTFFHRGLRKYGVPAELVVYPREPHAIGERAHQIDMAKRIAGWYQRWIPVD